NVSGSAAVEKLAEVATWRATGRLAVNVVQAFGWSLTDAAVTMALRDGRVRLSPIDARLEGAPVAGSAELKLASPYEYAIKLNLTQTNLAALERLSPDVRPPLHFAGRFDAKAEVHGKLRPLTYELSGAANAEDLRVQN